MDETMPYVRPSKRVTLPSFIRQRHLPNVPEAREADFLMEHLNDPNYDLKKNRNLQLYSPSDIQTESHMGSNEHLIPRAGLKDSTEIDFDEYAFLFICSFLIQHHPASLLILKFELPSRASMIQPCPSIHSACDPVFLISCSCFPDIFSFWKVAFGPSLHCSFLRFE